LKLLPVLIVLIIVLFTCASRGYCTEEFARKTGKECAACHLDPAGGGELTAEGKSYAATIRQTAAISHPGIVSWLVRLVAGYIHMLTAFLWFGTILYVHLVLKPAYASQGLPKGEVRVGLVSMAVMAVTGAVLMYFRVSSLGMLFHSWFGVLLLIKVALFLVMVISALIAVLVIGPRLRKSQNQEPREIVDCSTIEGLSQFDGKEGRTAYFACNGRVFDVSASKLWKNGLHVGRHQAGCDLSEALKLAPHGEEKVLQMPVVAMLSQDKTGKGWTPQQRLFFFMAHMNLVIVFCIILIIALWRWGL
jgi:predicted heme/steroid binding protein